EPSGRTERGFDGPPGMRHHAHHIALAVADAGNGVERAVGIRRWVEAPIGRAVAENDLVIVSQLRESVGIADVAAFSVRDRKAKHLPAWRRGGERSGGRFHADVNVTADEAQSLIAHQSAGQKPGFAENLKAIANAEDETTRAGEPRNRVHYRRKTRDRAGAQIIAVGEAAGQNHGVETGEVLRLVPDGLGRYVKDFVYSVQGIVIAVRSGKYDDTNFRHAASP